MVMTDKINVAKSSWEDAIDANGHVQKQHYGIQGPEKNNNYLCPAYKYYQIQNSKMCTLRPTIQHACLIYAET